MTGRRPWLASLLALLYPGAGHAYLREWGRALLWFILTMGAAVLVVPADAIEQTGPVTDPASFIAATRAIQEATPLFGTISIFVIIGFSVVDAYMLAREAKETTNTETSTDELDTCPECGKPLDEDLSFCHWCTTEFDNSHDKGD